MKDNLDFPNLESINSEVIPTGALTLDKALGGGLPRGRIIEVYGEESSGKTTLALSIIKQAQKLNLFTAFIDQEHTFNRAYAAQTGVNLEQLMYTSIDDGLGMLREFVYTGLADVVIFDSAAAIKAMEDIEGFETDDFLLVADQIKFTLRAMGDHILKNQQTIIFLNQVRHDILKGPTSLITPGGKALKTASSIRMELTKGNQVHDQTNVIGFHYKANIVQNKYNGHLGQADLEMYFQTGLSWEASLYNKAWDQGLISSNGSWYIILGERIGQGRMQVIHYLEQHPDICRKLLGYLLDK